MVISLRLSDGWWLNFATPPPPLQAAVHSRIFWPGALLLVVVVVVSIWAVRRATQPLSLFAQAAERLGLDFNAPKLDECGPREVLRAAKAFNQMQDRLQAFVKDRTHMLAAISHDLRTPITRLKLRAEFIEDDEQRTKMLSDLDEMEYMISSTLKFARDDAANEPAEHLDMAQLVKGLTENLDVTCRLPDTLAFVGRPLGLKRLVGNLLGNAQNFGTKVEIELSEKDGCVELVVLDDGPGIPDDMMDRVFEPFVRVENSRSRATGGTGLGLVAVKMVAQAHGGTVELSNRESGGLKARVTLPLS
ncbi:MAG: two-component sensor histidine kinase [Rhodospirillaceae bacterium]|nr:MAG: two-component sensor histidine kinase [Rhodospirillaceae bacterium]